MSHLIYITAAMLLYWGYHVSGNLVTRNYELAVDTVKAAKAYTDHRIDISKVSNRKLYLEIYRWMDHHNGDRLDCATFVSTVFEHVYDRQLDPSDISILGITTPTQVALVAEEGDLVFFKINSTRVNDIGIYLRQGNFAHILSDGSVQISNIHEPNWSPYLYNVARAEVTYSAK
jgi:cell wall-associated NlpC family hydrolase